ncbi:MAG: NAD(P)-binding domain-containing protein [Acetobacterium woodii]|nr:NAD(P)-binding domain-containing protein [Acetobacterium woodii]
MNPTVRFIGAGNIVKAMLGGVAMSGCYAMEQIGIFDVSQQVRDDYKKEGYMVFETIEDLVKGAPLVVVAVTPQVIGLIIDQIKSVLSEETVLISLAAGINNIWYQQRLGESCKVVRCMPTLPAQVGLGAFAVSSADTITDTDFCEVEKFLSSCGIIEEIPETLMCEVVPINGSAPAYFYHMAHVIVEEAGKMGLDKKIVLRLFAQTMKGSAEMLMNSGMSAEELEGKLRLPGGTTIAALEKMDELGFDTCLKEGIKACVDRCKVLAQL